MDENRRPWGHYEVLHREPGMQIKRIEVKPGLRFSLQKHQHRSERWIVASGEGVAMVGMKEISVQKGAYVEIQVGEIHRLQNTGRSPLVIVEVQFGDCIEENDIVRLEDDFGRS